jgi:hypothetical protein
MKSKVFSIIFLLLIGFSLSAQYSDNLNKIFANKTEIQFKFKISTKSELNKLNRIISIDKVNGLEVFAYANKKEFSKFIQFNYDYEIVEEPSYDASYYNMLENFNSKNIQAWDFYPTYSVYDSLMNKFQTNFPNLCKSFSIKTLASGRKLIFVKISDNPDSTENEPKFLYTSSMHGDELTGAVLMLRLIDYLLSNYSTNPRIANLINNTEIWINPMANPNGTYASGNSSVSGATRYNGNGIDLNRNFPDPQGGQHPDGNNWQEETMAFMALADSIQFTMAANFHGGAEVCNYPFDTWAQLAADDNWWSYVCREYADTVHAFAVSGYLDDLDNGITNGYAWYQAIGARQDYMNYFKFCREFTMEISNTKKPAASTMPNYWNYNYRSFLNYIEQCQFGLRGIVTDSVTGQPLKAKIFIQNHDRDSSHIYSVLPLGNYFRPIFAGSYSVTYSANGYYPKTVSINVLNRNITIKNVKLVPTSIGITENNEDAAALHIYPNPAKSEVTIDFEESIYNLIVLSDVYGKVMFRSKLSQSQKSIKLFIENFTKGIYFINLEGIHGKNVKKLIIE